MKLKCRCGGYVAIEESDVATSVNCGRCGRAYAVSRDAEGKIWARAAGDRAGTAQKLRGTLSASLELDITHREPTAPRAPAPAQTPTSAAAWTGPARRSWWRCLGTAWVYPFRGDAKWTLLFWVVGYNLCLLVAPFLVFPPGAGLVLLLVMLGVLLLYEFELIRQSAWDAAAAPRLPTFESLYESAFRPLGHLVAVLLGSFLPLFLAWAPAPFVDLPEWWGLVRTGALLISLFMVPMNLLAVATADYAWAINPKFTFPGVVKIIIPYLVFYAFCVLVLWIYIVLQSWIETPMAQSFLVRLAASTLWVYLLTVLARALGTLHYVYSDRIGWVA